MMEKTTQGRTWEEIMEVLSETSPLLAGVSPLVQRRLTRAAWIVGHIDRALVLERFGQEGIHLLARAASAVRSVVEGETTPGEVAQVSEELELGDLENMNTRVLLPQPEGYDPEARLDEILAGEEVAP